MNWVVVIAIFLFGWAVKPIHLEDEEHGVIQGAVEILAIVIAALLIGSVVS